MFSHFTTHFLEEPGLANATHAYKTRLICFHHPHS